MKRQSLDQPEDKPKPIEKESDQIPAAQEHAMKPEDNQAYIIDLSQSPESILDSGNLQYKDGSTLEEQITWLRISGDLQAARERYEAGIAVQTADTTLEAISAMLKSYSAGKGPEAATEKMIEYEIGKRSINDELKAELEMANGENQPKELDGEKEVDEKKTLP